MRSVCPARVALVLALLTAPVAAWAEPYGYSVNSRGFLPDDQVHRLFRIDLATGSTEKFGQTGFIDIEGLALAPDGTLYGADDQSKTLITINPASGFASPVGGEFSNMGVSVETPMDFGMTFTCDGELLVSSDNERSLFTASLETGRLERIGEAGSLGAPITDIASRGDQLFGIGQGLSSTGDDSFMQDSPNLYRIDPVTATAELVGPLGPAARPYANAGLAFDASGQLWAVTDRRADGVPDIESEILRIDPESGTAEKAADADVVGFESLAVSGPGGCGVRGGGGTGSDIPIIPANNRIGLMLMALAMLAAGLATLGLRQR